MKRLISLALVLCLLLAVFPVQAGAQEIAHVIQKPELLKNVEFPDHWARDALVFCVGNGIMQGKDNGLAHLDNTSRAETAAMLVRLLNGRELKADLSTYTDLDPTAWYYPEISSAVALGILKGVSETEMAPNAPVTREQVFTMFCRAFGLYPKDNQRWTTYTDGKKISTFARNAISALTERECIKGCPGGTVLPDQPITRAELAQLIYGMFTHICDEPSQLPEAGNVLYRGEDPIADGYALNGRLTLACGASGQVELNGISVNGELCLRPAPGSTVALNGCSVLELAVAGDTAVTSDQPVQTLYACGFGSYIKLDAQQVWVGESCTLVGTYSQISCTKDVAVVRLEGVTDKLEIRGNGVSVAGTGIAQQLDLYGMYSKVEIQAGKTNNYSYPYDYENALSTVQTVDVWDTVTRDTYLYSGSSLYGVIRKLPAGTKLRHYYLHDGAKAASVYTTDGVFGYVPANCIRIPEELDLAKTEYSQATMEGFVDQKGYSSSTGYLIWVSLKTQTVNVFSGRKGNWTLLKSMPCASGKPATPTVKGTFRIQYHYSQWVFDGYKVRYVSGFYEGYAFHSVPWNNSFTNILDPTVGLPASHGCLRMRDEDCKYIYDNIPYGTTVVVY